MSADFPDDTDGDALRRVAEESDLSKPMTVDFFVVMPDQPAAERFAQVAADLGYNSALIDENAASEVEDDSEDDDEDGSDDESSAEEITEWACECSSRMLLTYDGVIALQQELSDLATDMGGYLDGWGTMGNAN